MFIGFFSLMGMSYTVLLPVFAKDILHGGPDALGFLIGASGVGALIGAIYLASRKNIRGLLKLMFNRLIYNLVLKMAKNRELYHFTQFSPKIPSDNYFYIIG